MGLAGRALAAALSLSVWGSAEASRAAPWGVQPLRGIRTWAVYYGAAPEAAPVLARFDLVVLDPARHPPLEVIKRHGALVLFYVSLGEINAHHADYAALSREPWVLDPNPNWPDARRLDVRAAAYERWILDRVAPAALGGPANGLFLDTADTALHLEATEPQRFGGALAALTRLVRTIRDRHPRALLVLNGGLPLAERLGPALDGVAVESIWTDYDFERSAYRPRAAPDAEHRAGLLGALGGRGPVLLTLDYVPAEEGDWAERLIAAARARGFVPYVAPIGLDRVFTRTLGGGR